MYDVPTTAIHSKCKHNIEVGHKRHLKENANVVLCYLINNNKLIKKKLKKSSKYIYIY